MRKCTTSLCQSKEVGVKWLADQEHPQLDLFTYGRKTRPTLLFKFRFTLAITGFMLLVFMTTHPFQFHGGVYSAR